MRNIGPEGSAKHALEGIILQNDVEQALYDSALEHLTRIKLAEIEELNPFNENIFSKYDAVVKEELQSAIAENRKKEGKEDSIATPATTRVAETSGGAAGGDPDEGPDQDKEPTEQDAKDAKRMSDKELNKAAKNNGYKNIHDMKDDLGLSKDTDIFSDKLGRMYSGGTKGYSRIPEYLHMNTKGF